MTTINLETILKLQPCQDRLDNYIKYYKDKEFTPRQFMGLKNITHGDKIWVSVRLIPKQKLYLALADIAESVLPIFEKKYPADLRPRMAIEALRSNPKECRAVASDSAYAAAYDAAYAADYAAAHAAAYAAAVYAAAYAAAADGAYAAYAAHAAVHAAVHAVDAVRMFSNNQITAIANQEKLIRTIILKYWK